MDSSKVIAICFLLLIAIIVLRIIRKHFKVITMPNVFLITGAIKTGKTLLSVHLARKEYRKALLRWYVRKFFRTLLHKDVEEKPMLYSNIHLARTKYNILSLDIILCKVRIPPKSIVLLDEASLLADSMMFKDKYINERLMQFVKLFAHYSHGGKLIIDTQSLSDLHFSFKRCLNNYIYIYSRTKLPFITIMKVREMLWSDDNSMINVSNEDIELSMRKVIIFNGSYKLYDCYCYSSFTDFLPMKVVYDRDKKSVKDDLKCYKLVSFHNFAQEINDAMKEHYGVTEEV